MKMNKFLIVVLFWNLGMVTNISFSQYIPAFIHDMVEENGLEIIYPAEESKYRFRDGDHTKYFPYDFKLKAFGIDILVQIDKNQGDNHPHIKFARNLADLAFNSEESFIRVLTPSKEEKNARNADWMLEADFRPKGLFLKPKGKLVSFYSDNGSIVNLVYLYKKELVEEPVLRVKSYEN